MVKQHNDIEHEDDVELPTDATDFTNVEDTDITAELAQDEANLEEIEDLEESKLKTLRDKVARLDEEKRAVLEELATVKADFLNARKRLEEDKLRGIERQKIKDIEALLPLADAFTMAMSNADAWNAVDETWRKGVEGIYQNLVSILSSHGVESFDPTGEAFDPNLHEALSTTPSEQDTDTVVSTMQLGYKLGDTVIRAAKVVISE